MAAAGLLAAGGLVAVTTAAHADSGFSEQEGHHGANTFSNYHNASGVGPAIGALSWVKVSCKVYDSTIVSASPDGYWYRISSPPWNDQYYAVANTFMNGDPLSGPYTHNTDFNVPDCGAGQAANGSVSLGQGPVHNGGYRFAVTLSGWAAGTSVSVNCRDSADPGGFFTFTMVTDSSGAAFTNTQCYSGDGPDHWVVANNVESNHVAWGAAPPTGGGPGGSPNPTSPGSPPSSGGPALPQPRYSDPCMDAFGPANSTTHSIFGGSETDYDRHSSLFQVCEGFGSGQAGFSPEMKCAAVAAITTFAVPGDLNQQTHDVCDALGFASAMKTGDWANWAKGQACTFVFDTLGEGAGIAAAGATSETGPSAVAVGVNTYRAIAATGDLVCGAFFDNGAHDLGVWIETGHEAAVARDIQTKGLCLHARTVFGYLSWSAAPC